MRRSSEVKVYMFVLVFITAVFNTHLQVYIYLSGNKGNIYISILKQHQRIFPSTETRFSMALNCYDSPWDIFFLNQIDLS